MKVDEPEEPRIIVQRTSTREWGPMAWETWVDCGVLIFASEYGNYAWTRKGAVRKGRRLMKKYRKSRRGPREEVEE